jgi:polar amino acid transport system substrate-binding protein
VRRPLPRRALALAGLGLLAAPALRAQDPGGALGQILRHGRLRAGVWLRNAPWGMLDDWDQPGGYEVALLGRLAGTMGVRLDLTAFEAEARLPALEAGEVDMLAAGLPVERRALARVALARPHGRVSAVMAMRRGEAPRRLADLEGRRVAVPAGTFFAEATARGLPPGTEVIFLDDPARCLQAVANRHADGAAVQEWVMRAHLFDVRDTPLHQAFVIQRWRIAFAVGLGEWDLLHMVNSFLRLEHASGALAELQRVYFRGSTFEIGPTP